MESPWDDDPAVARETEWTKISSEFTNAGYREGITAGKESALQEGFDDGFARVGAPLGRELGILRGLASSLLSFLASAPVEIPDHESITNAAREITSQLSNVRFSDIAPRDLEAEEHARQHLKSEADEAEMDMNEGLDEKRKMEGIEDMLAKLTAGTNPTSPTDRPTTDDVRKLKDRLESLSQRLGLDVNCS